MIVIGSLSIYVSCLIEKKFSTYRPREVEGKHDGIGESFHIKIWHIQGVSSEHRSSDVTECTRWCRIDVCLINFEAHSEFSPARRQTRRVTTWGTITALPTT